MQVRLKYSSKDRRSIKYGLLMFLFSMGVLDKDEVLNLIDETLKIFEEIDGMG